MSKENASAQAIDERDKVSWFTRISYGLGDTSCNIVWGAMSIITFFYTDYAGVAPATVGLVMLLSRCFDGISDITMGFLVEKTNSKWGKSRPWILWTSAPFCISLVLIYLIPQGSDTMQFAYIFVTYNLCTTVCYTALNLPYGSLSAMMTRSSDERAMLSLVRMALSPIGKIISVSATLPLIKLFGDNQAAWIKTMGLWAFVAFLMLLLCFWKCDEKVVIEAREKMEKLSAKMVLRVIGTNKYFWLATGLWTIQACVGIFIGTILPYYCKYVFMDDTLFGTFFLVETSTTVIATVLFCTPLLKKYGKRKMSLFGGILALVGHAIYLTNPYDVNMVMFSCFVRGLGFAPLSAVVFGFFGDVVEYTQWKYHARVEGLVFSGGSVGYKIGGGLVSAAITGLMSAAGYIASSTANAVQPQEAIDMIVRIYEVGPMMIWSVLIIILLAWKLEKIYPQIMNDLAEREARGEI